MAILSPRARLPVQEGASKRLQRLHYLFSLIQLAMPEGIERPEVVRRYAVETGLTERKAEEHLGLLEECNYVVWYDLRLYTTDAGLRWAGYKRDHRGELVDPSERAEEKYRKYTRANAQKALSNNYLPNVNPPQPTKVEKGNTAGVPDKHPDKSASPHARETDIGPDDEPDEKIRKTPTKG